MRTKTTLWLVFKIAIIVLATFLATNMPQYINSSVSGFVPSEEIVSRNLNRNPRASKPQVSALDIKKDLNTKLLESGSIDPVVNYDFEKDENVLDGQIPEESRGVVISGKAKEYSKDKENNFEEIEADLRDTGISTDPAIIVSESSANSESEEATTSGY